MRPLETTYRAYTRRLLRLLDYVARHGGITAPELVEEIGFSRATFYRALNDLRQAFGVSIVFDRRNAEYGVRQWGVIDQGALRRMQRKTGRPANVRR